MSIFGNLDKADLDRHITGNYGEDQFPPTADGSAVTFNRLVKHINAFRSRYSVRFLGVIYGPQAKPLRTQLAAMMLGRKVTGSDKAAQYGNLREALLKAAGIELGVNCRAVEDRRFEEACNAVLSQIDNG